MLTNPNLKTAVKLLVGAVGMFVFAMFVMPPIYDVFCDVTGLGGKTGGPYQAVSSEVDPSRVVKVQFVTTNNGAMAWDFSPKVYEVKVHPGESTKVEFYAKNQTRNDMVAQAIPSLTPFNAAEYFHKTECFCFNQQPLKAGMETSMPVVFIVDKDLPAEVKVITLSYTLFDVTDRSDDPAALGLITN